MIFQDSSTEIIAHSPVLYSFQRIRENVRLAFPFSFISLHHLGAVGRYTTWEQLGWKTSIP